MHGEKSSNLTIIENGQINTYVLDDKTMWEIGRPSKGNYPDIKLYSNTISRKHGRFQNMNGIWFYMDGNGKNGTFYNGKRVRTGLNGRVKPTMLSDGDIFIFGTGDEAVINCKTVWARFSTVYYNERWKVLDTKGHKNLTFTDGNRTTSWDNPEKGLVVELESGIAIYMGDLTYLVGNISLTGE